MHGTVRGKEVIPQVHVEIKVSARAKRTSRDACRVKFFISFLLTKAVGCVVSRLPEERHFMHLHCTTNVNNSIWGPHK